MRIVNTITSKAKRILPNDFVRTTSQVHDAIKRGWANGREISKVNNRGLTGDLYTSTKCVAKEIKNLRFERKDIPVVAAAIAYIAPIPIPGLTLYTYGIALGITKLAGLLKKK